MFPWVLQKGSFWKLSVVPYVSFLYRTHILQTGPNGSAIERNLLLSVCMSIGVCVCLWSFKISAPLLLLICYQESTSPQIKICHFSYTDKPLTAMSTLAWRLGGVAHSEEANAKSKTSILNFPLTENPREFWKVWGSQTSYPCTKLGRFFQHFERHFNVVLSNLGRKEGLYSLNSLIPPNIPNYLCFSSNLLLTSKCYMCLVHLKRNSKKELYFLPALKNLLPVSPLPSPQVYLLVSKLDYFHQLKELWLWA